MSIESSSPSSDGAELEALRRYARACVNIAIAIHAQRKDSCPTNMPKRARIMQEEGPHRGNGRPRDPNPDKEGRDMHSIAGEAHEGLSA